MNQPTAASWSHALQLAFAGSVALLASFVLAVVFTTGGWIPGVSPSETSMGTLFVIALLQAGVGTVLAVALLFMKRANLNYAATLAVHVMESALLGVLLFVGSSA